MRNGQLSAGFPVADGCPFRRVVVDRSRCGELDGPSSASCLHRILSSPTEDLCCHEAAHPRRDRPPPAATTSQGVSRPVRLSSFGVGRAFDWSSATQKAIYRTLLRSIYADKAIADERIRSSESDWTAVLPTRLTNGPAGGVFSAGDRMPPHIAVHDGRRHRIGPAEVPRR
ncbi:NAD(P)H-binding protein [Streptomyces sp. NPDC050263]|uniref:NAD(P)H-binding protein n=1 Tax=Streptomyces sp. NPDC050263 TaxID=3155037 RepID=UPI00343B0B02